MKLVKRCLIALVISSLVLSSVIANDESDSSHEKSVDLKHPTEPTEDDVKGPPKITFGFFHAFLASFSVIVVSEIGDKTFFIAAIMAMKHPRLTIYAGAMFALGLMTLLSALLGNIITQFIPKVYTFYASSVLFALFGLKMLHEGYQMEAGDATEECEEAHAALKESEDKGGDSVEDKDKSAEPGPIPALSTRRFVQLFRKYLSAIFLQAFILTFLAEWGDRSQISTIILGARENIFGTVVGGTLGHGLCTGVAVLSGRMIASKISVRTVTLVGAVVFIFFALSAFFVSPEDI